MLNLKQFGNTLIYIGSDLLVKALPFFLIPIITRYLSVEEYGEVSLALTFIEICTIVLIFGSHHYYRYEFFKGDKNKEQLLFVPIRIALFNFIIIYLFILSLFFISDTAKLWYLFVPIAALFQSVISLYICKFQTIEKPIAVGSVNFSQAIVAFAFTVLVLSLGFGVDGRLGVVILTPILIGILGLVFTLRTASMQDVKISKKYFKSAFKFGSKAFPSSVSWWLRSGMDRVLLLYMVGTVSVGVFSIAVQFSLIITVISGAINNSIMPSIFRNVNNKLFGAVFKSILVATALITLVGVCLILISPILIDVVLPIEYRVVGDYFTPLIIGAMLHAFFLFSSNVFVAESMVAKLSAISILSSIFHLLISIFMIYSFGLKGVVWSGVISYAVSVLILIFVYSYSKQHRELDII